VFVVSIFLPFLRANAFITIPEVVSVTVRFWSFKYASESVYMWSPRYIHVSDSDFGDYLRWVDYAGFEGAFLIFMLVAQFLTFSFAVLAIVLRRFGFLWHLLAAVSSVAIVCSMWLFSRQSPGHFGIRVTGFEPGFYLAIISALMFSARASSNLSRATIL
jgi:hypothetical protein